MTQTGSRRAHEDRHLRAAYPQLIQMFEAIGPVRIPRPSSQSVSDAVIRSIVGQMLSARAACTIHTRLMTACKSAEKSPWRLDDNVIRDCGLSARKARSIREFGCVYEENPERIESWQSLPFADLRKEVASFWGLSDWTAAMLAIFQFGHPDVFPLTDGTIIRVIGHIESQLLTDGKSFDHTLGSPFGTHLALTFWKSNDIGYWRAQDSSKSVPARKRAVGLS